MNKTDVIASLKTFFQTELLEGSGEVDEQTQLIELGLIDSMSIVLLLGFASKTYGVEIPVNELTPAQLGTLPAIADLILKTKGQQR